MKKLFTNMAAVLLTAIIWAQSPQKMSYQAVIRDAGNVLVASHAIGMRISILQGSAGGTEVYTQTQTTTTNANGLVSIEIGAGEGFDAINWANNTYFIKTEIDLTGGTIYTITAINQLLSVPYALHAKTVEEADFNELLNRPTGLNPGDMLYWNGTSWINVPVGLQGQLLQLSSSLIPIWSGPTYPTVATTSAIAISSNSVRSGGNITNDGGGSITSRGVCWSTSENPTVNDNKTTDGTGSGGFSSSVSGLKPNTDYYIRAYAINSAGLNYGDQVSFTTLETMSDITGQVYNTVAIGTQIWMKENLQTNKYNDETVIPYSSISGFGGVSGPAFYPINSTYGSLYNGYAVATNKLCPTGWHIPSDEEWKTLEIFLGMTQIVADLYSQWRGTDQGSQLKSVSFNGTNASGFTALGGGWINEMGVGLSVGLNDTGKWWTGTVAGSGANFIRELQKNFNSINRTGGLYGCGSSIRCIKDN